MSLLNDVDADVTLADDWNGDLCACFGCCLVISVVSWAIHVSVVSNQLKR